MGGGGALVPQGGGHEDAHDLLPSGDDTVREAAGKFSGGGNLRQRLVQGSVELIQGRDGGGALALVRDPRGHAVVTLSDGRDGLLNAGVVAGSGGAGRIQQQVGHPAGSGDHYHSWRGLGGSDGRRFPDARRVSDRCSSELEHDHGSLLAVSFGH